MPKRIDADEEFLKKLEGLSKLQCTDQEMCLMLAISAETLHALEKRDPRVAETIKKGRATGLCSLRRAQFVNAVEKNNVTMQIWLGKQYLNQTDRQEIFSTVAFDGRIARWLRDGDSNNPITPEKDNANAMRH